ncbi:hypothetical protein N1851_004796 [Merluccius polli]|uniref:Uncharacterized protein n=1 Tax=Merluccius polli TaxID=89951 RepID=A0AA47P7A4_MERPO|nr:hypothetical protein N1851_004796 [Merluccius polli]
MCVCGCVCGVCVCVCVCIICVFQLTNGGQVLVLIDQKFPEVVIAFHLNKTISPHPAPKTFGIFALYNIRRIRPFLTRIAAQLLVPALVLSRLDYCSSLLAGLPASAIKPLQRIQNPAARLVFNLPKFSHVTPPFRDLHWLPVAALRPHAPARTTSARWPVPPSLRASKGHTAESQLFSVLAPLWWNDLPADPFSGLPNSTTKSLQLVQNAAAALLTRIRKYDHITPILASLHWFPITARSDFKVRLLAYKTLHGLAPSYLKDLINPKS